MKDHIELTGGILVLVISEGMGTYFFGENSYWLLDDWETELSSKIYLKQISSLMVDMQKLDASIRAKIRPEVLLNLDEKTLISNYFDQALERRLPIGWQGQFFEEQNEFLSYVPIPYRFWEK